MQVAHCTTPTRASNPVLIIAGAEKCGTTSVYTYLAAHPGTCPSTHKETDYFRRPDADLAGYLACFPRLHDDRCLLVESSPAYMALAEEVAPRIARSVPEARIVFLLRDPIARLRSSFRFYKSRLHVPQAMSFDAFARLCLAHEGGHAPQDHGLKPWHIEALARGRYERQLPPFEACFPDSQRLILTQDELNAAPRPTMQAICRFAGLDPAFFEGFAFTRENVSFLARHPSVQRAAIAVNDRFEPVWRRFPSVKRRLLQAYKGFNERSLEPDALDPQTETALRTLYAPTYAMLADLGVRRRNHAFTEGSDPAAASPA